MAVPRARLTTPEGGTAEWKSQALRAYQRRTLAADALIARGQINMRKVDVWQTLSTKPIEPIDLAA